MSTRVVERVDDWAERPFSDGYRGLQQLADSGFSGVVRAGGGELFMTRGAVVGIQRATIEDFGEASGTIYDAPADALPLLAFMQERSDEVRAKYYSEDTSISEVGHTLESGGFTGYIELSENVLSGDYYLVYHQGTSMSVAYVGNNQQLLTDDEAFERADDEVGIYEVRPVDIKSIGIPEPPEPNPDPVAGGVPDDQAGDDADALAEESPAAEIAETVVDPGPEPNSTDGTTPAEGGSASAEPTGPPTDGSAAEPEPNHAGAAPTDSTDTERTNPTAEPTPVDDGTEDATATGAEPAEEAAASAAATESTTPNTSGRGADTTTTAAEAESVTAEQAAATRTEPPTPTEPEPPRQETPPAPTPAETERDDATTESVGGESPVTENPSSLETWAIPSLDPERTSARAQSSTSEPRRDAPGRDDDGPTGPGDTGTKPARRDEEPRNRADQSPDHQRERAATESAAETGATERTGSTQASAASAETERVNDTDSGPGKAVSERIDELQELLDERETEIQRLESSLSTVESERDNARQELVRLREERDELQERVDSLEAELQRLKEELGAATDAQQRMTPQEALSGTDIFVRYRSKGDATLEKAHQSGAVKKNVVENLRLENHTQFDADISAVDGREYDEFLKDTVAYRFVRWVVEDLVFEIQGTGHTDSLNELYDALPKINRVELNGAVNVTDTEDGQETQTTESFDVVVRERMGDPLLVADINNSRQGASQGMMENLITAAERVGQTSDQFASAFLVTESFFEPEALETVAEATRGGILSRDKRKSFVNLSRKRGYHLCLVEARNQNFHLEVPEL
jgi:archaellum component FlaC